MSAKCEDFKHFKLSKFQTKTYFNLNLTQHDYFDRFYIWNYDNNERGSGKKHCVTLLVFDDI